MWGQNEGYLPLSENDEPLLQMMGSQDHLDDDVVPDVLETPDATTPRPPCRTGCPEWLYTLIALGLIIIVLVSQVMLFMCTFFWVPPIPEIDLSLKSFNIPDHEVSLRNDALNLAKSDAYNAAHGRKKRDVSNAYKSLDAAGQNVQDSVEHMNKLFKHTVGKFPNLVGRNEPKTEGLLGVIGDYLHRFRRSASNCNNNGYLQLHHCWKLTLVYLAQGDESKNIFTKERLETIHNIEKTVVNHPNFTKFCYKTGRCNEDKSIDEHGNCAPLNSLLTYFYPTEVDGYLHYNGLGDNLADINSTLTFALNHESTYYFVDEGFSKKSRKSHLMRSEVHFGCPLEGYAHSHDRRAEQNQKYHDFVISYIDVLKHASTDKVQVLYGSNELYDYQVKETWINDVKLAFFSVGFILVLMYILTSFSMWLTVIGFISIIESFPFALFLYSVAFKVHSLGILNGAAAFVIVGIGVDDVFVFINTFRQADHITDLMDRIKHTIKIAGKATFFTSFTTAAAFAANVASAIPAVHQFGLFMALIVSGCWIMVMINMPCALIIWHRCFSKCEAFCFKPCRGRCQGSSGLELPPDIQQFLDAGKQQPTIASSESDSDDVPMLTLDEFDEQALLSDTDDMPLDLNWDLSIRTPLPSTSKKEGCNMIAKLQAAMYYYIATPVVKARWVIVGLYIVILGVSIGLMVQLKPATKPPQLFASSTNLQQLLDLAVNMSDKSISCDRCSGYYEENPKYVGNTDKTTVRTNPPVKPTLGPVTVQPTTVVPSTVKPSTTKGPIHTTEASSLKTTKWPWLTSSVDAKTKPQTRKPTTLMTTTTTTTIRPTRHHEDRKTPKPTQAPKHAPPLEPRPTSSVPSITLPPKNSDSASSGYKPCEHQKCNNLKERPHIESTAVIHVVFGIVGVDRSNISNAHVFTSKGKLMYDPEFEKAFTMATLNVKALGELCKICKLLANNTKLTKPNTTQCLPHGNVIPAAMKIALKSVPECQHLPDNANVFKGRRLPAQSIGYINRTSNSVKWLAFAYESTTAKGLSYFEAYQKYQDWEKFIRQIKKDVLAPDSPLHNFFQTSEFWKTVMMEVVAVSSAIYGLVLSMIICVAAVAIFTGHPLLLLIVFFTILGMICLVVAIFYMAGWRMGAVEAVSLSILVGSSVDYCVHLVEGYLLAGNSPPTEALVSKKYLRRWRTKAAIAHIGVSILSSAVTTIIAAIPLTQTNIQPFAKFGEIVAINTSVSILYTLTGATAFLCLFAPAYFTNSVKSSSIAFAIVGGVLGAITLMLFIISKCGVSIPGPNGHNLFS